MILSIIKTVDCRPPQKQQKEFNFATLSKTTIG